MKKGREPLLYTLSSLSSFLLDTGLFSVLHLLLKAALGIYAEPVCNLTARTLSSFYNFNMNRLVFRSRGSYGSYDGLYLHSLDRHCRLRSIHLFDSGLYAPGDLYDTHP
jgi:hypothetical protein